MSTQLPLKEWHSEEERLLEKSTVCTDLLGTVALSGQDQAGSGIFPAHGRRTRSSKGFTPLWGPSFLSWGWGHTEPPKTHPQCCQCGCPLKMTKRGGGDRIDIGMSAPGFMQGCSERLCQTKGLLRRMFVAAGLGVAGVEALPAQPSASGKDTVVGLTDPSQVLSGTDQRGSRNFHFVLL